MSATETVFDLYAPGTTVYVVNAALFGVAIATIVSSTVTGPSVSPVITYTVTYNNTTRTVGSNQVLSTMVYPDVTTAVTAYTPLIT